MSEECLKLDNDSMSIDVLIHPDAITAKFVKYGLYEGLELIGFAVVNIEEDSTALARLYVSPKYRRTGAGTMLMDAAKPSHLCCNSKNKIALSFYNKNGFNVITPEDSYFHVLETNEQTN